MKSLIAFFARLGELPRYQAAYDVLEQTFQSKKDPWDFERDPYESARFGKVLEVLRRVPHASILEVGCAEGHLTRRLSEVCEDVTGIDVSPTAVRRAQAIAPRAKLFAKSLEEFEAGRKFDVVLCTETLYYFKDVAAALQKLNELGHFILVTYTLYEKSSLDPFFSIIPCLYREKYTYLKLFNGGRVVNWRGVRVFLWWSGAWDGLSLDPSRRP